MLEEWTKNTLPSAKRARRSGTLTEIDDLVFERYAQKRQLSFPVSGDLIRATARELAKQLGTSVCLILKDQPVGSFAFKNDTAFHRPS